MKLLYKIIIFLIMFQFTIPLVNIMGIFPSESQLYSDMELPQKMQEGKIVDILAAIFFPAENNYISQMTWGSILAIFIGVGALTGIATHSIAPAVMIILIYLFIPMINSSKSYFDKLFLFSDNLAVIYMGTLLFVGIAFVALITVVEQATHGRSG